MFDALDCLCWIFFCQFLVGSQTDIHRGIARAVQHRNLIVSIGDASKLIGSGLRADKCAQASGRICFLLAQIGLMHEACAAIIFAIHPRFDCDEAKEVSVRFFRHFKAGKIVWHAIAIGGGPDGYGQSDIGFVQSLCGFVHDGHRRGRRDRHDRRKTVLIPEGRDIASVVALNLAWCWRSGDVSHAVRDGAVWIAVLIENDSGSVRQFFHALGDTHLLKRGRVSDCHMCPVCDDDRMVRRNLIQLRFGWHAFFCKLVFTSGHAGDINPFAFRCRFDAFGDFF